MIKKNKLDKAFGPSGSFAGLFMFIIGLIVSYNYFSGFVLVVLGAFIAFTKASTHVDMEGKKLKFSSEIFGFIPIGKWIKLRPEMEMKIKKSHKGFRTYSRGNRSLDIHVNDYRIVLLDRTKKQIGVINKFRSLDEAKSELESLKNILGVDLIS